MNHKLLLIVLGCVLCGCGAQPRAPTHDQIEKGPLSFLQDGTTTREDVLLRLGTPTGQFEGDRILTFRLAISRALEVRPASRVALTYRHDDQGVWNGTTHELVVVFDGKNVVQKHRLIQIQDPR